MSRGVRFGTVVAAALAVLSPLPSAAAVIVNNSTYGYFDGSSGTRSLSVVGAGTISDIDLTIDFSKCDDPAIGAAGTACTGTGFSYNDEIVFRLTGPDGSTTVNLVDANTYGGQTPGDRIVVTFDDEAATTVGGSLLQDGTFRPVSPLSTFDGLNGDGTWTLFIGDTDGLDPLEFFSATLTINADVNQVPEPGTLAVFGIGLLGLGALRRRRRSAEL